jgi:hypothetical protein
MLFDEAQPKGSRAESKTLSPAESSVSCKVIAFAERFNASLARQRKSLPAGIARG